MKEWGNGVFVIKKEQGQDDEDFGAVVCWQYYKLIEDFFLEEGTYNFMLNLLDKAFEMGIADRVVVASKIDKLMSEVINKIIDMSLQRDELPVPDINYFLYLYERFEGSDKSFEAVKQTTEEFMSAVDDILDIVDYYYNDEAE